MTTAFLAVVMRHGLVSSWSNPHLELGLVSFVAMLFVGISLSLRYRWSLIRQTFLSDHKLDVAAKVLWVLGIAAIVTLGPFLLKESTHTYPRGVACLQWSEAILMLRVLGALLITGRRVTATRANPAVIMVMSFLLLVVAGTSLLMLPRCTSDGVGAPLTVALFTSTSASCVTGLSVVPTDSYWSRTGQYVILALFQIGGLGILTFGAFFAALSARGFQIREHATLQELLEFDTAIDARRLILMILGFTVFAELIGAVLISGLWSDEPFSERAFQSVFHSVSAFCNAGFTLLPDGFIGMGSRWQVWGPLALQIVLGAAGFTVIHNLYVVGRHRLRRRRFPFHDKQQIPRLTLTTRLAVGTSVILLVLGSIAYFLLESTGPVANPGSVGQRTADAWFQSATFRTAGFNTTDHGEMQPATKLFSILLMFVGASPGSTGGGIKTVCFALCVMAVLAILRGRDRVEFAGRTIPTTQVNRALTVLAVGLLVVATTTLLLVVFERQEARFLDHLFEATSAFATVGVSTGITAELTTPSKLVIIVTMFLGRVGPLTLLIALAGRASPARYDFPQQRVTLG